LNNNYYICDINNEKVKVISFYNIQRMRQNIKQLFRSVENKTEFIELLSKEFNRKPASIRNNWFSAFYSIPQEHEARVVELLQRTIAAQIQKPVEA
tara:strand:- start:1673 stop:1960 length:288 start_codon:yes stop_codon:yes gene_type:complete